MDLGAAQGRAEPGQKMVESAHRRPACPRRRPGGGRVGLAIGSPDRTRTSDPVVNSHLLYQLSY